MACSFTARISVRKRETVKKRGISRGGVSLMQPLIAHFGEAFALACKGKLKPMGSSLDVTLDGSLQAS